MGEAKVSHLDQIEGLHGGIFKPIGSHLGVTAFGVNLESFPQNHEHYPEHDHAADGQEEVYIVISGRATLTIDDQEHDLRAGSVAYVPSGTRRRWSSSPSAEPRGRCLRTSSRRVRRRRPPDIVGVG
jgi:uncharacterized cupin superfamily protein